MKPANKEKIFGLENRRKTIKFLEMKLLKVLRVINSKR
jgi:hypothetical protein